MARGDHLRVYRGPYWHHGIDLGNNEVIHFNGEPTAKSDAKICRTSLEEFIGDSDDAEIVDRDFYKAHADTVVQRALDLEGNSGYNVVVNNCEHFALYCKTNARRSEQIEDFLKEVQVYEKLIEETVPIIGSLLAPAAGAVAVTTRAAYEYVDYKAKCLKYKLGGPDERQKAKRQSETLNSILRSARQILE